MSCSQWQGVSDLTIGAVDYSGLTNSVSSTETFNQQAIKVDDHIWACGYYLGDAVTEVEVNVKDVKKAFAESPSSAVAISFKSSDRGSGDQGEGTFTYSLATPQSRSASFSPEDPTDVTMPYICASTDGVTNPLSLAWA